jgi:hypothetical protein
MVSILESEIYAAQGSRRRVSILRRKLVSRSRVFELAPVGDTQQDWPFSDSAISLKNKGSMGVRTSRFSRQTRPSEEGLLKLLPLSQLPRTDLP